MTQPQMTTWRQEAHAAVDAGVAIRLIALTLPADSRTRQRMLEDAEGYVLGALLRGVKCSIVDDLRVELDAGDRLADERLLEVAA